MAGCSREHGSGVLCHCKSGIVVGDKFAREYVCWIIPVCVFVFGRRWSAFSGGLKAKEIARTICGQRLLKHEELAKIGMLGSRSLRKFAATHTRQCGVSKDEKDIRGRWKGKGQVSDVYNDNVEFPYPDCKASGGEDSNGQALFLLYNQQQDLRCDGNDYLHIE